MNGTMLHSTSRTQDHDGLRLLALSRIPRCTACPRLAALQAHHRSGSKGPVPAPPRTCTTRYCSPLVKRYGRSTVEFLPDEVPARPAIETRN